MDFGGGARSYTYTRAASDLTFSATDPAKLRDIGHILQSTQNIVTPEGLTLHPARTCVLRQSHQQEVGVIVNRHLNIDRATLKRFSATLDRIEKDGLAGTKWGIGVFASIVSANYGAMVNPAQGRKFSAQVQHIRKKYRERQR